MLPYDLVSHLSTARKKKERFKVILLTSFYKISVRCKMSVGCIFFKDCPRRIIVKNKTTEIQSTVFFIFETQHLGPWYSTEGKFRTIICLSLSLWNCNLIWRNVSCFYCTGYQIHIPWISVCSWLCILMVWRDYVVSCIFYFLFFAKASHKLIVNMLFVEQLKFVDDPYM